MIHKRFSTMLIDDDPLTRKLLKKTLRRHGYALHFAPSGCEGIAQTVSTCPDLIILELDLPDMDGKEAIREIRTRMSVPIFVLSNRTQSEEKIAALDAGADNFIEKPFNPEEIAARIRTILRRRVPIKHH